MNVKTISVSKAFFYDLVADYVNRELLRVPHIVTDLEVFEGSDEILVHLDLRPEPPAPIEERAEAPAIVSAEPLPDLPAVITALPVIPVPPANGKHSQVVNAELLASGEVSSANIKGAALDTEAGAATAPAPAKSPRTGLTDAEKAEAIRLYATGHSAARIAELLGKYPSVITGYLGSKTAQAQLAALASRRQDGTG